MKELNQPSKVTSSERLITAALGWAPWLAFFLIALPAPLYFVLRRLSSGEDAALYALLALTSLAVGSLVGLVAVLLLLFYRRRWGKKLRDKLAADGITTDELWWFLPEMTRTERGALNRLEKQNLLLADAYRETLASRLTATRIIANAKRERATVERRLTAATRLQGTERTTLEEELRLDRERTERIEREAVKRRGEAEGRLQMIEAAASRNQTLAETQIALQRLNATGEQVPLGLEASRLETAAREQADRELRKNDRPSAY